MHALVLYDSNYGNTEVIAKTIAQVLNTKAEHINHINDLKLEDYDLIVVGSPINGWRPTKKISTFIKSLKPKSLQGIKATTFDTRLKIFFHGDAAKKIANALHDAGAKIITEPKGFYVKDGEGPLLKNEMEKAIQWAHEIEVRCGYGQVQHSAHTS